MSRLLIVRRPRRLCELFWTGCTTSCATSVGYRATGQLNFASTNAFQATRVFAQAVLSGMRLDDVTVEESPYARPESDAWDVKLKFFDPENLRRARQIFRFTVDVSDVMPVTLGEVRQWSVSSVIDRMPPQVPPVRRPDLVQPHTILDLMHGSDDGLMVRLMSVEHGCNLNDPPQFEASLFERRGSK